MATAFAASAATVVVLGLSAIITPGLASPASAAPAGTAAHPDGSSSSVEHHWVFQTSSTTQYCHMSTIELLPGGTLAVAFQAAHVSEGDDDQSIFFKTGTVADPGSWTPHRVVVAGGQYPVWGPVLHWENTTQALYMWYSVSGDFNTRGPGRAYPGGNIYQIISKDEGQTWGPPQLLLPFYSPSRGNVSKVTANKIGIAHDGTWMLPYWQEAHTANDTGKSCAGVLLSHDKGASWQESPAFIATDGTWLIENSLAQATNGSIYQVFRTTVGHMYASVSDDVGETWSPAVPTDALNPNSKQFMFRRSDTGNLVLAYNPSSKARDPLALAQSTDSGATWHDFVTLDSGGVESFAYPTSVQVGSNVFTTYSASTKDGIKLAITALP